MSSERRFPMDVTDEPWHFHPEDHLVVILHDEAEAARAVKALASAGFPRDEMKTYRGEDTLANHDRYAAQRSMTDRIVGAVTDDDESRRLYLEFATKGRTALWVFVPDEARVATAIRALADVPYLHVRHYGRSGATDYRTRSE
jgi:hypothetical protein